MTARLLAFVIWAAVAATAVFWGLRLFVKSPAAPRHAVAVGAPGTAPADLTRLFGAEPTAAEAPLPQASNRFKLVGLVAPRAGGSSKAGIALIAVDDKPARAFHVGASVDGRLVVQTVQKRSVSLGPRDAPAEMQLELPPPPPAATGTLPLPGPAAATTQKPGAAMPPVGTAPQAPRGAVAPRNPPVDEQTGEPPANEAEPAPR